MRLLFYPIKTGILLIFLLLNSSKLLFGQDKVNTNTSSYELIWNTLLTNYYDSEDIKKFYNKNYNTYKNKVIKTSSSGEFKKLMNEMFYDFKVSHLKIISIDTSKVNIKKKNIKGELYEVSPGTKINVWIDTMTLENKIGYIKFNIFANPLYIMPFFNKAIKSYSNHKGLIIDLRDNPGGNIMIVTGMLRHFISDDNTIGYIKNNNSTTPININPSNKPLKNKIAVLINENCQSGAELFAATIQEYSVGKLFGNTTSGSVMLANVIKLPNGLHFEYPYATILTKNNNEIEGVGVKPDYPIEQSSNTSKDEVLNESIKWINKN